MTTRFKSALDHIEADEALVNKTERYLRNTLAKEQKTRMADHKKWRMMDMKKFAIAACMAILLMGGGAVYATPSSHVSVDLDKPSMRLGVNAVGHVVTAEALNEDGETVLDGTKVKGKDVKEAVRAVVDAAAKKGYIEEDSVIALTTENDDEDTAGNAKLKEKLTEGAEQALDENNKSAEVSNDTVALDRIEVARALGITPGKLNLIQKLQASGTDEFRGIVLEDLTLENLDGLSDDDKADLQELSQDLSVQDIMAAIKQARIEQRDETTLNSTDDVTADDTDEAIINNGQGADHNNKGQGAISNKVNGAANRNNIEK